MIALAASGCDIRYKVAGSFTNANEVFVGDIVHNLLIGEAEVEVRGRNSGIVCRGKTYVTYYPPFAVGCAGQRGKAELTCEDGRSIDADWHAKSCTTGSGRGQDEFGNRFNFAFGLDRQQAEDHVAARLPKVRHRPSLRGFAPDPDKPAPPAPTPKSFDRKAAASGLADFPMVPIALTYKSAGRRPDDIAVIIGNASYNAKGSGIPDIVPAYADAEGSRNFVVKGAGVPAGNVVMVRDATSAELTYIFGTRRNPRGKLAEWIKPGRSRVFVFYAGHGAPGDKNGRGFLVPVDVDGSMIGLKGYPLDLLFRNLSKLQAASVTLVLETSFSGISESGNVLNKMLPDLRPKDVPVPSELRFASAGAASQVASWEQDNSHGLFTKYFLKGMSGLADAAHHGDGDGTVAWGELDTYLKATLSKLARKYYGRRQIARVVPARRP